MILKKYLIAVILTDIASVIDIRGKANFYIIIIIYVEKNITVISLKSPLIVWPYFVQSG